MSNIDIYANEYLGKIFYFCLKKTGNEQEAADLSGEINLEVVQAFMRGKEPDDLAAWIWIVARNRWAKWAAKKYYHAPEQVDIRDYEEAIPSEESVEEDIIHSEELALVRRGLAFIRSDYRKILVAHYFEEKSVSEISRQFGIPLGTVKTKLQSSRKILKEGMDMARQFGTRSFQPETVSFFHQELIRQDCLSRQCRGRYLSISSVRQITMPVLLRSFPWSWGSRCLTWRKKWSFW